VSDQTKYFNFYLPEDEATVWGDEMRDNWTNLDDQLQSIKNTLGNPQKDMQLHRESGDHDNRYYTKTELDGGALDSIYFTKSQLNGGYLDGLYYTKDETFFGEDQLLKWDADAIYMAKSGAVAEFDKRFYTQNQLENLSGPTPTSLLATKAEFDALVDTINTYRISLQNEIDTIVNNFNNTKDLIELVQVKNGDGSLKIYYTKEGKILGYSMQIRYSVVSNGQVISYPIFYVPYAFNMKGIISQKNTGIIDPDTPPLTGWRFDSEVRAWTLSELLSGDDILIKPGFSPSLNQFQYFNFGIDDNLLTMGDPNAVSATTTQESTTPDDSPFASGAFFYTLHSTWYNNFKTVTRGTDSNGNSLGPDLSTNKIYSTIRKPYTNLYGRFHFFAKHYYSFSASVSGNALSENVLLKIDYDGNILKTIPIDFNYTLPVDNNNVGRRQSDLNYYLNPNSNSKDYFMQDIHVDEANNVFYLANQLTVKKFNLNTGAFIKNIYSFPVPTNTSFISGGPNVADPMIWGIGMIESWIYIMEAHLRKAAFGIIATLPSCNAYIVNKETGTLLTTRVLPYSYDGSSANWMFNDIWFYNNKLYMSRSSNINLEEFNIDVFDIDRFSGAPVPEASTTARYDFGSNVNETQGEWDGHFTIVYP